MADIASIKKLFFDRKSVLSAVDEGTRKVLAKFGAFVRQRSRSSLKTKKGTSAPGAVPYSHTGKLKGGILFAYDPSTRSVVIGPTRFGSSNAPRLLESGGVGKVEGRPANYPARPFMRPAFVAELAKVGDAFKNMIQG